MGFGQSCSKSQKSGTKNDDSYRPRARKTAIELMNLSSFFGGQLFFGMVSAGVAEAE